MGQSGKLRAKNDKLIEEIIEDPLFKIQKDGRIFSKITLNGQGISDDWREVGYEKADGYVRFRYKGEFLFVHRVIYRKFNGELDPELTINHKNMSHSDNRAENLELGTQLSNNVKKIIKERADKEKKAFLEKVIKKLS